MEILWRILGLTAGISSRLSRTRVNGIPLHLFILFVCVLVLVIGGDQQLRDADQYARSPERLTVQQALQRGDLVNHYVTLEGTVATAETVTVGSRSSEHVYVPLVDRTSLRGLLVERDGTPTGEGPITGMLRRPASDVRRSLKDLGNKLGELTVTEEYVLHEGAQPANPAWYALTLVLTGIPALLLIASLALKHVVFRKTAAEAPALPENDVPVDLRVTGKFRLTDKIAERFLNMPAGLGVLPSGERAFVSNIDASVSMYGMKTEDRAGYWAIVLRERALEPGQIETGSLYVGPRPRPALRIRFSDAQNGKPSTAVLSFRTEVERAQVHAQLLQPAEAPEADPEETPAVPEALVPPVDLPELPEGMDVEPLTPFVPRSRCSAGGLVVLLAATALGSVLLGGLYQLVTRLVEMPVLFALAVGMAAGGVLAGSVYLARCRAAWAVALAALTAGVLTYGTRLVIDSQQARPEMIAAFAPLIANQERVSVSRAEAQLEHALDPARTLRLYLSAVAANGVGIGRTSSRSVVHSSAQGEQVIKDGASFRIRGGFYWGMLLLEAVLIAFVAFAVGAGRTREAFCDACGRWHKAQRLIRTDPLNAQALAACVHHRRWDDLLRVPTGGTDQSYSEATVTRCPTCADATIVVRAGGTGVNQKPVLHARLPADAPDWLRRGKAQPNGG